MWGWLSPGINCLGKCLYLWNFSSTGQTSTARSGVVSTGSVFGQGREASADCTCGWNMMESVSDNLVLLLVLQPRNGGRNSYLFTTSKSLGFYFPPSPTPPWLNSFQLWILPHLPAYPLSLPWHGGAGGCWGAPRTIVLLKFCVYIHLEGISELVLVIKAEHLVLIWYINILFTPALQ